MSAMVVDVPPGGAVPPHTHGKEEEGYFVLEGELELTIGEDTHTLAAGDFGHVPPRTVHGYTNASAAPVRFLAWTVGGPIDQFFEEMSRRVRQMPQDAPALKLRWYGQSFFQLETGAGQLVVFDPHAIPAFHVPRLNADICLISHRHNDHALPEVLGEKGRVFHGIAVSLDGKKQDWAAIDEKVKTTRVRTVGTFHDATGGMTRGKNTAWVVETDGLVFCHLGDLGHELSPDQVKAIGPVDVLMVPVGGVYTINGEQAKRVVDQIKPKRYVLPMHYGVPGFDELVGPDEFLYGEKRWCLWLVDANPTVLRAIPRRHVPVIVFVTAHDRYALSAFEASAVDYVLKPFNRARFLQAVGRAKIFCSGANAAGFRENIAHLLSADSRLKVRSGRGVQLIPLSEIDWIEAANNHACVHCSLTTHIVRETLRSLETRLGSGQFARIHRSIIVNLSSVREVRPAVNGDALVVLGDGTQLPASRTFSENLAPLLSSG